MRIVVVEDEIRTRLGLCDMIPSLNEHYSVDGVAENGYEGLKMILELRPEIVVTDIKMPRMNGLKMIEEVIESRVYPSFIILSGFKDFEYAKQGISLGVKEYLLKPITMNELRRTLNRVYNQLHCEKSDDNNEQQFSYYVEKMMKKIHTNYAYQLCLTDFSNDFRVTPEYLSNLFSKETGYTFSAYLRHYRIEQAIKLLKSGNKKIYEIACCVGYSDPQYFSRVFKDITGVSAKRYLSSIEIN